MYVFVCLFVCMSLNNLSTLALICFRDRHLSIMSRIGQKLTKWHVSYYIYIQFLSIIVALINGRLLFSFLIARYELLDIMCLHCILLVLVLTHLATVSLIIGVEKRPTYPG